MTHSTALPHLALIELSGKDTETFLQGQCTQDIKQVGSEQPMPGVFCTPKGRVVANVWLQRKAEDAHHFALVCERSVAPSLAQHLKKYAPFFRGMTLSFEPDAWQAEGCFDATTADKTAVWAMPWADNRLILWHTEAALSTDSEQVQRWQAADIRSGRLWVSGEQSGEWIPQNLSLDSLDAVSFKKGCYTGQEVVARLHFKGQSKKRLFALQGEGVQVPEAIFAEAGNAGPVVQSSISNDGWLALAVLRTDRADQPLFADEAFQQSVEVLHSF